MARKRRPDLLAEIEQLAPRVVQLLRERFSDLDGFERLDDVARLILVNEKIAILEREVQARAAKIRRLGFAHAWQRIGGRHRTR